MKILHIITSTSTGGAEMMLYKLMQQRPVNQEHVVISLCPLGEVGERIKTLGVEVYSCNFKHPLAGFFLFYRLLKLVKKINPNIIQGWMYHGNLMALVARFFRKSNPIVIWNIRQSLNKANREKWLTGSVIRLCAFLSNKPTSIIYCSENVAQQHQNMGFSARKSKVLFNGFDLKKFNPADVPDNFAVQLKGKLADKIILIQVARFHPMKGHRFLLESFSAIKDRCDAHLLLVGKNLDESNQELFTLVKSLGLLDHVSFLGEQEDVASLYSISDVAVSPSLWGEGFPNVVGEAMAMGLPCVVTDVGDSAMIVDDCGLVVPPGDVTAMSRALKEILTFLHESRQQLSSRSRERIEKHFDIKDRATDYFDYYNSLVLEGTKVICAE